MQLWIGRVENGEPVPQVDDGGAVKEISFRPGTPDMEQEHHSNPEGQAEVGASRPPDGGAQGRGVGPSVVGECEAGTAGSGTLEGGVQEKSLAGGGGGGISRRRPEIRGPKSDRGGWGQGGAREVLACNLHTALAGRVCINSNAWKM